MEWERSESAAETIVGTQRAFFIMFYSSPTKYHAQREILVFSHSASVVCFFFNDTFFQKISPVSHMVLSFHGYT